MAGPVKVAELRLNLWTEDRTPGKIYQGKEGSTVRIELSSLPKYIHKTLLTASHLRGLKL